MPESYLVCFQYAFGQYSGVVVREYGTVEKLEFGNDRLRSIRIVLHQFGCEYGDTVEPSEIHFSVLPSAV